MYNRRQLINTRISTLRKKKQSGVLNISPQFL